MMAEEMTSPSMGSVHDENTSRLGSESRRQRRSRFIENFDAITSLPPPAWFTDDCNRSSYTLVNSHNSSIMDLGANQPESSRLQSNRIEKLKQLKAQRQHPSPSPPQPTSPGPSKGQGRSAFAHMKSSKPVSMPQLSPLSQTPRLRDSQGRPTAFAIDQSKGRYPLTDPRSINNSVNYSWLRPKRDEMRYLRKGGRVADMQRRGAPCFLLRVPSETEVELVPARPSDRGSKKKKTKGRSIWVAAENAPGGAWGDVSWGRVFARSGTAAAATVAPSNAAAAEDNSANKSVGRGEDGYMCSGIEKPCPPKYPDSFPTKSPRPTPCDSLRNKLNGGVSRYFPKRAAPYQASSSDVTLVSTPTPNSTMGRGASIATNTPTAMASRSPHWATRIQTAMAPLWKPTAITTASTNPLATPPLPAGLENDLEAQETGPLGEPKYGEGDYAAVVALASRVPPPWPPASSWPPSRPLRTQTMSPGERARRLWRTR